MMWKVYRREGNDGKEEERECEGQELLGGRVRKWKEQREQKEGSVWTWESASSECLRFVYQSEFVLLVPLFSQGT